MWDIKKRYVPWYWGFVIINFLCFIKDKKKRNIWKKEILFQTTSAHWVVSSLASSVYNNMHSPTCTPAGPFNMCQEHSAESHLQYSVKSFLDPLFLQGTCWYLGRKIKCLLEDYSHSYWESEILPDYSKSPTYQCILLHLEIKFVHKSNKSYSLGT